MEYQVVELCKYGDFDGLITDIIMLAPKSININEHIESFWFEHRNKIDRDYVLREKYIPLNEGIDDTEMIQKFVKQMQLYGCIIPKKTTIKFGD